MFDVAAQPALSAHPARTVQSRVGRPRQGGNPAMPKLLLDENTEYKRDMLLRRLAKKGFEVVVAVDGGEGVAKALPEKPDLILMDMHLPVLDGWEATKQLKEADDPRAIPITALTPGAMSRDRGHATSARR